MAVRIGFIGTGGIAKAHFDTLEQIEGAQPVAFCDVSTEAAESAARRFEGRAYSDPRKMLEAETLDAVYVCVPPHAHGAEILAAQKGCAVFIEKPVSNSMKAAEKIAAAIESAGVISSVGYHYRYYGSTERMQKIFAAKGAAQPEMSYGYWIGGFPGVPWWRNMDQSGGQLNEQATHIIDVARYLMGDIKKVYCAASQRAMHKQYPDSTVPDVTALTVEYQSGAVGTFSTSCLLGGLNFMGLDLLAHNARYELRPGSLQIQNQNGETSIFAGGPNAYLEEDRAFIKAVKTGKRLGIRSTYADALKTQAVTMAANQSARTGKAVTL